MFVCLHGAGHSALSFAVLAKQVKKFASIAAFDFKGHGASKKTEDLANLSKEALVD